MKKNLIEVLTMTDEIEDAAERASFLRKHMRMGIQKILATIHNPDIQFETFVVEYSTRYSKNGISDSSLEHELARLYIFEKSCPLVIERKTIRLIQILEGLYNEEADLLFMYMLNKLNPYKNISKSFLKKYFPEVFTTTLTRP